MNARKMKRLWPHRMACLLCALLVLGSISGCAVFRRNVTTAESDPTTASAEESKVELSASSTLETTDNWSPQVIRAGSLLNIHVYVAGNREVDMANMRVSETGTITLPLIGRIAIAGRSLHMATRIIEHYYNNYFVSPQVTMDIVRDDDSDSFPWGFVTVLGRVKHPGRIAIPPTRDLSVSSAIQQAGGFDTSARIRSIRVTRQLSNGESEAFDVNMHRIGRRGRTDQDIRLMPNDVVFVPEMIL